MQRTPARARPGATRHPTEGFGHILVIVRAPRVDDALVAAALAACAVLCVAFRYLPMVDLPQHYAMVSILVHLHDPAWGFAQRYTTDFAHRPYATVYWLGEGLAHLMPLGAAMRIVVAVCTVAPLAGAHALLVAIRRPRAWLLAATPFAFGSLWHWGFLNFLLGTGMFLAGLALVVRAAERPSRANAVGVGALGVLLFFTHFHGLVMLLLFAPLFAWAWAKPGGRRAACLRALGPLAPSALGAAAFVLVTWRQAEGAWAQMNPGIAERVQRFPEFLAGGSADPWPVAFLVAFVVVTSVGTALGSTENRSRRVLAAAGLTFAAQIAMYFLLPLNTNTATYVSARHALLVVLLALPLLPALEGRAAWIVRGAGAAVAIGGLWAVASQLACFDREARDVDDVFAAMKPDRRVVPLVFARGSPCTSDRTFPYLHFAAYYQAAEGGDLSRSFAVVWNVPIRYRADYARYPIREQVEWSPGLLTPDDARHYDYALVRGGPPRLPPALGFTPVTRHGAWALYENATALPADLPPP